MSIDGADCDLNDIAQANYGQNGQNGDSDVQSLIRWKGSPAVILTDGVTGRWVSEGEISDLETLAAEGRVSLADRDSVRVVGRQELRGQIVGPRPAEWGPDPVVTDVAAAVAALPVGTLDASAVERIAAAVIARPDQPLSEAPVLVVLWSQSWAGGVTGAGRPWTSRR